MKPTPSPNTHTKTRDFFKIELNRVLGVIKIVFVNSDPSERFLLIIRLL